MQAAQQDHRPKRSASQGTLRISYTNPGRPLHKPLRSVNENSVLLPSPGALGGMLKTTTETGDIGIFSIKPTQTTCELALSSGTREVHDPESHPLRKLPCRSLENIDHRDGHDKPPSHRDTASEILSMYGSNNQSSVTSMLSQSIDDPGGWSYSITTVGSRPLSQKKPDVTVQRQPSSSGALQRPRSPYPYPTRLKRPGTRPVSPAVTESGLVDYSKTVEIDRVSYVSALQERCWNGPIASNRGLTHWGQRTAPGPSRPFPCRGPRLQAETNNQIPLFSAHTQFPITQHHARVTSARTLYAASDRSWGSVTPRGVFNSPTPRASSLTSVINTYQRMPPTLPVARNGPQVHPPRYYDYTEDFEGSRFCSRTPMQPIAPVPTRIHSVQRAMVLREGSEEKIASGLGEEPSFAVNYTASQYDDHEPGPLRVCSTTGSQAQRTTLSTRHPSFARCKGTYVASKPPENKGRAPCNGIDFLPSQANRVLTDEINSSLDIDLGDIAAGTRQDHHWIALSKPQTVPSGGEVQLQGFSNPAIRIKQVLDISTVSREGQKDGDGYEANSASNTQPLAGTENITVAHSPSVPTQDKTCAAAEVKGRIHETNSTQSPMVEQPVTADPGTPDKPPDEDHKPTLEATGLELSEGIVDHLGIHVQNFSLKSDQTAKRTFSAAPDTRYGYRRHKRHNATLDIFMDQVSGDTNGNSTRLASASSGPPLFAPQPTSPAMQLRIKNSIPKLMKALPALPVSSENRIGRKYLSSAEGNCCSQILQPPGQPHMANPTPLRRESTAAVSCHEASEKNPGVQKKLRRIRLRSKEAGSVSPRAAITTPRSETLPHTRQHRNQYPDGCLETGGEFPRECNREESPRAKSCTFVPPETVKWHPGAHGSHVVAALVTKPPNDLFTSANRLATIFQKTVRGEKDVQGDSNVVNKAKSATRDHSPTGELRSGKAGFARRDEEEPSFWQPSGSFDRKTVFYAHRLKKRISGIGWLVGRTGQGCWQDHPAGRQGSAEKKDGIAGKKGRIRGKDPEDKRHTAGEGISPEVPHGQRFRGRIRNKISKWARETKNAMKGRGLIHLVDSVDGEENV